MVTLVRNAIIASGLLLLGVAGHAQVYQDRDYYTEERPVANAADQVRADLDQLINTGYLTRSQRLVLAQAREDLQSFDRSYAQGEFDRHELNEAIGRLQSVANSGRLPDEQRAILQDDVEHLRELRASAQSYGYGYNRYNNGYYRGNGYYRNNNRISGYYDQWGNWRWYR
jgi:hypothetical protein